MAKSPITNHHQTSPLDAASRLTTAQLNGIDLLIVGKHDHEVAAALGLARETVSRWRLNPHFVAALNQARHALWTTAHERLRSLLHRAVDILEAALNTGDLKAALELLKIVQLYGAVPAPTGPTDPEIVLFEEAQAWAAAQRRREGPTVDPLQVLLDEHAGHEAAQVRERLQELRQAWGLDEDEGAYGTDS